MNVSILGYVGRVRRGSKGFYVDFDNYNSDNYQEHWNVVGLIAQHYNLVKDPLLEVNWRPLFKKLYCFSPRTIDFDCRFPEFKEESDLLKFVNLLNNNLKEDPLFVDLTYLS